MKLDRIIRNSFSELYQIGFSLKKEKAYPSISYCLCKESVCVRVSIDMRENTVDFKIKVGTTVRLLIQSEEIMINAPIKELDGFEAFVHDEYKHIRIQGLTTKRLQNLITTFADFLRKNYDILDEHDIT